MKAQIRTGKRGKGSIGGWLGILILLNTEGDSMFDKFGQFGKELNRKAAAPIGAVAREGGDGGCRNGTGMRRKGR